MYLFHYMGDKATLLLVQQVILASLPLHTVPPHFHVSIFKNNVLLTVLFLIYYLKKLQIILKLVMETVS